MQFSKQEYWSGLPLPSPRNLPDPRIKPVSPVWQADSSPLSHPGKPTELSYIISIFLPSCASSYFAIIVSFAVFSMYLSKSTNVFQLITFQGRQTFIILLGYRPCGGFSLLLYLQWDIFNTAKLFLCTFNVFITPHKCALEKKMVTHSNILAWRIPGTEESGGLPSMGSHRVGHD